MMKKKKDIESWPTLIGLHTCRAVYEEHYARGEVNAEIKSPTLGKMNWEPKKPGRKYYGYNRLLLNQTWKKT